jgi:hypothetical protein
MYRLDRGVEHMQVGDGGGEGERVSGPGNGRGEGERQEWGMGRTEGRQEWAVQGLVRKPVLLYDYSCGCDDAAGDAGNCLIRSNLVHPHTGASIGAVEFLCVGLEGEGSCACARTKDVTYTNRHPTEKAGHIEKLGGKEFGTGENERKEEVIWHGGKYIVIIGNNPNSPTTLRSCHRQE